MGADWALEREQALGLLGELVDTEDRLEPIRRRRQELAVDGAR